MTWGGGFRTRKFATIRRLYLSVTEDIQRHGGITANPTLEMDLCVWRRGGHQVGCVHGKPSSGPGDHDINFEGNLLGMADIQIPLQEIGRGQDM